MELRRRQSRCARARAIPTCRRASQASARGLGGRRALVAARREPRPARAARRVSGASPAARHARPAARRGAARERARSTTRSGCSCCATRSATGSSRPPGCATRCSTTTRPSGCSSRSGAPLRARHAVRARSRRAGSSRACSRSRRRELHLAARASRSRAPGRPSACASPISRAARRLVVLPSLARARSGRRSPSSPPQTAVSSTAPSGSDDELRALRPGAPAAHRDGPPADLRRGRSLEALAECRAARSTST